MSIFKTIANFCEDWSTCKHTETRGRYCIPWSGSYQGLCATVRVLGEEPGPVREQEVLLLTAGPSRQPQIYLQTLDYLTALHSNTILIWLLFWWLQDYTTINLRFSSSYIARTLEPHPSSLPGCGVCLNQQPALPMANPRDHGHLYTMVQIQGRCQEYTELGYKGREVIHVSWGKTQGGNTAQTDHTLARNHHITGACERYIATVSFLFLARSFFCQRQPQLLTQDLLPQITNLKI